MKDRFPIIARVIGIKRSNSEPETIFLDLLTGKQVDIFSISCSKPNLHMTGRMIRQHSQIPEKGKVEWCCIVGAVQPISQSLDLRSKHSKPRSQQSLVNSALYCHL